MNEPLLTLRSSGLVNQRHELLGIKDFKDEKASGVHGPLPIGQSDAPV